MWSEHHLDLGMCTKKTPLLLVTLRTCASNHSKHSALSFFAVLQCHYQTMFFVLHISYELEILPIFVSIERFLIRGVTRWGPAFLLSVRGFFRCCYISGCYCWPSNSPGKIFSPFPKRYNPHTHHTVSDPCLHDT